MLKTNVKTKIMVKKPSPTKVYLRTEYHYYRRLEDGRYVSVFVSGDHKCVTVWTVSEPYHDEGGSMGPLRECSKEEYDRMFTKAVSLMKGGAS